jgi:glycosyltransferase involved in cell wall biosynthesis
MRIAQIVERLEIGGLERMTLDLALAYRAAGHVPLIYCVCADGPLGKAAREQGIDVRVFHKAPGFSAGAMLQIARSLRADRVDIVHTHNSIIHHYGAVAGTMNRMPVVNTQHGLGTAAMHPRLMRNFRLSMPFTDAVVFVADEPKRFLWEAHGFPRQKGHVILNGIPLEKFTAQMAAPGSRPNRIRFGTVGRMVPVKDHATLVRAFAAIAPRLPGSELQIVGYGVLESATQQLADSLGVGTRFRIHPPDTDVPQFLSELDVFVMSSQTEGLPVCLLEAMAAGLPVASTRVGGIPEAAPPDEVAWYCVPGKVDALAGILEAAARSGELARRGARASAIVGDRFSIQSTARQYLDLFGSLVS